MDVKPHYFGDEAVVVRLLLSKLEGSVECRIVAESCLTLRVENGETHIGAVRYPCEIAIPRR